MRRKTDLLGQKIGYLIVISESETINKLVRWRCRCVCGNETVKFANDLKRRKKFISCGCKANLHKGRKKYDPITKSAAAIYNANLMNLFSYHNRNVITARQDHLINSVLKEAKFFITMV
jgi:hypothetical protein